MLTVSERDIAQAKQMRGIANQQVRCEAGEDSLAQQGRTNAFLSDVMRLIRADGLGTRHCASEANAWHLPPSDEKRVSIEFRFRRMFSGVLIYTVADTLF
ncbi:hypothetical protein [Marinomonas atlantica]|uniref:hypothetical protein n=1 Tax=Marinomonas atlantica TaxID=1806668 RepID=UPI0008313501|nr:hypothetical protein [Marinomonas atlantica]